MRTVLVLLTLLLITPSLGTWVILAGFFGVKDREGGLYDWAPRFWARAVLRAAGVRVVLHNAERMGHGEPCIYVSNHVSWFDVFTLAGVLPHYKFVGKAELFRIPFFGRAARTAGMIPIVRENRKLAVRSLEEAASHVRGGVSVVLYPEGTRGTSYSLRPFKKGPFILAAAAQVPVVPTIIYGSMIVQPKGSYRIRSGTVHVHFLEPLITHGMTYDDRDRLSDDCWRRMAAALKSEYGVDSTMPPRGRRPSERQPAAAP
jgi:1-acyl-sn-glycerol-3-phosphate acyltransferase